MSIHVFDFELLRGATENSHVKVIKDGVEQSIHALTTDKDGNVLLILENDDNKGGELDVLF